MPLRSRTENPNTVSREHRAVDDESSDNILQQRSPEGDSESGGQVAR